jgi:GTP cyclohydrolase III
MRKIDMGLMIAIVFTVVIGMVEVVTKQEAVNFFLTGGVTSAVVLAFMRGDIGKIETNIDKIKEDITEIKVKIGKLEEKIG